MRKKVSIHIFLALILIFSSFPVFPTHIAAASEVISPIDGRNTFDGTILDYGYIAGDTINNYSESTFKFNGIDSARSIVSSYIAFESFEGHWTTISNLKIAITDDSWPGTATVMPTLVTPEKSINSSVPGIFSSIIPYNPTTQINTYRIDVSSLMTSSSIGADGIISLLMSTTSVYDAEISKPRLEINYAAAPVNTAPVLNGIGIKSVNEKKLLTFTATASDAEGDTLTYSLGNAPTGASINSTTGVFTWTPTEAQGPDSFTIKVIVSDGALTDEEEIIVTVNEVNEAPVLAAIGNKMINEETELTFTATATDVDLPANTLTYSLVGAPTEASINPITGVFTWTPTEAQGPGSYPFTVRVSDGILIDSEQITITVNETNAAPILGAIGNKTVNEGSQLTFTVTATDADSATLTYGLVGAPTGASINATTGLFTWIPSETQGPGSYPFIVRVSDGTLTDDETITVTVKEVNVAPVLVPIGNKTVNEGSQLTFTATATDADLPANILTYSLVDAPTGASINATTGVFTWTPTEAQGPDSFTIKVIVSDGALTDEEEIIVTVNEINEAPVLAAIGDKTVDEETLLTFTAVGTDTDMPANTLTYSLVDTPTGASINAATGEFTWTPTEAQGPGSFTFKVVVSDGVLTDEEEITVTVNEVNTAPVLAAIGDKTVDEETLLTFTAVGTDTDLPANTLMYSLVDAPTGASINAATGEFTWTPTEAQGPGSYAFKIKVSDGALTDEETITITVTEVNPPPTGGGTTPAPVVPTPVNPTPSPVEPVTPSSITIKFETGDGTLFDALNLPYNTAIHDLPVPAKVGFKFEGWYQDRELKNRWEDGTKLTQNMTLYAKWEEVINEAEPVEPEQPAEPVQPLVTFTDTEGYWANDILKKIAALGIIKGYPDGSFHPNGFIEREHIALMIQRAIDLPAIRDRNAFNDVPKNHPNYDAIMALANAGIIDGYNGNYNPDAPMTRAELAKMLVLAFGLTPGGSSTFADVSAKHWSAPYISALADAGIAIGNNGKFLPNEPVTRAQFVVFLYRALNL